LLCIFLLLFLRLIWKWLHIYYIFLCLTLFIWNQKSLNPRVDITSTMPSVLWRCWLGGRKGIRPVKKVVGCWHGICLEQGADLHMAQLMPLPLTVSCSSKIQIDFTFLVPAHLGSPGKRAVKRECVDITSTLGLFQASSLWHFLKLTILHDKCTRPWNLIFCEFHCSLYLLVCML